MMNCSFSHMAVCVVLLLLLLHVLIHLDDHLCRCSTAVCSRCLHAQVLLTAVSALLLVMLRCRCTVLKLAKICSAPSADVLGHVHTLAMLESEILRLVETLKHH